MPPCLQDGAPKGLLSQLVATNTSITGWATLRVGALGLRGRRKIAVRHPRYSQ